MAKKRPDVDRLELVAVDPAKFNVLLVHMPEWADVENIRRTADTLRDLLGGSGVRVVIIPGELEVALLEATDASGDGDALRLLSRIEAALRVPDNQDGTRPANEEEAHNP